MILLGAETCVIERRGTVSIVAGEMIDGVSTFFDIVASVQPLSGKERRELPEGYRTTAKNKAYSSTLLNTVDIEAQRRCDLLTWRGRVFEVIAVEDFLMGPGSVAHYKYTLNELGADEL